MRNNRETAYLLLRMVVGMTFLLYGIGKFQGGVGNFAAGMEKQFTGKMPLIFVSLFSHALPFVEVLIGFLLVVGLLTRFTLLTR